MVRRELGFKQTRNGNHSPHSYNLTNRGRAADLALQFRLGLLPERGPWRRLSNCPYPCPAPDYIDTAQNSPAVPENSVASLVRLRVGFAHSESPEGRKQNSEGLQPWEGEQPENRPERAADRRALFPEITRKRLDGVS